MPDGAYRLSVARIPGVGLRGEDAHPRPVRVRVKAQTERGAGGTLGYGLLLPSNEDTFLAAGDNFTVGPRSQDGRPMAIPRADELVVSSDERRPRRRLNGDETFSWPPGLTSHQSERHDCSARTRSGSETPHAGLPGNHRTRRSDPFARPP
ncbi:DUF5597 domain-containing protein [Streptomyces sp. NPDC047880]|uniref:DUF5597 domain-containing protein n=1 Tax=Streptomyces sp. NPDC047880 TaxID=3155626 RepID=UPI003453D230